MFANSWKLFFHTKSACSRLLCVLNPRAVCVQWRPLQTWMIVFDDHFFDCKWAVPSIPVAFTVPWSAVSTFICVSYEHHHLQSVYHMHPIGWVSWFKWFVIGEVWTLLFKRYHHISIKIAIWRCNWPTCHTSASHLEKKQCQQEDGLTVTCDMNMGLYLVILGWFPAGWLDVFRSAPPYTHLYVETQCKPLQKVDLREGVLYIYTYSYTMGFGFSEFHFIDRAPAPQLTKLLCCLISLLG
jgi:hypothetical protein